MPPKPKSNIRVIDKRKHTVRYKEAARAVEEDVYKYLEGNPAAEKISTAIDESPLPERLAEFASRYALEYRPVREWAKVFGVSYVTIYVWLKKPDVQKLIHSIKHNFRTYEVAKQLALLRAAHEVYGRILDMPLTDDNVEFVRRAARDVVELCNGVGDQNVPPMVQVNVNTQGEQSKMQNGFEVDLDQLEVKVRELKQIRDAVRAHRALEESTVGQ